MNVDVVAGGSEHRGWPRWTEEQFVSQRDQSRCTIISALFSILFDVIHKLCRANKGRVNEWLGGSI